MAQVFNVAMVATTLNGHVNMSYAMASIIECMRLPQISQAEANFIFCARHSTKDTNHHGDRRRLAGFQSKQDGYLVYVDADVPIYGMQRAYHIQVNYLPNVLLVQIS
jgi:hypothetical protein